MAIVRKKKTMDGNNFLDLVGSTESVEEVDERNPAFDRRQMCDRAQIHDLLRIGLSQHRKTGLTAGIKIQTWQS